MEKCSTGGEEHTRERGMENTSNFPGSEGVSKVSDTKESNELHWGRQLFGLFLGGEAQKFGCSIRF